MSRLLKFLQLVHLGFRQCFDDYTQKPARLNSLVVLLVGTMSFVSTPDVLHASSNESGFEKFESSYRLAANTDIDPVTMDPVRIDPKYPPQFHEVFIPFSQGKLTGFILTANGEGPHPTFVLAHGLPGNEKNLDLAQSMRRAGFNILFFHYQGSWGSEGEYSFTQLHNNLLSAHGFLKKHASSFRVDTIKVSLMGHSFGGYAVLRAATESDSIHCVAALSAANPAIIAQSSRADRTAKTGIGAYINQLIMLNGFPGEQAVNELIEQQAVMDIRNYGPALLQKKILLVVGEADTVTPPAIQKAVSENYLKVKGMNLTSRYLQGDHAYSTSRIQLQRTVVEWANHNCR